MEGDYGRADVPTKEEVRRLMTQVQGFVDEVLGRIQRYIEMNPATD